MFNRKQPTAEDLIRVMRTYTEAVESQGQTLIEAGGLFASIAQFYSDWKRDDPEGFAEFQRQDELLWAERIYKRAYPTAAYRWKAFFLRIIKSRGKDG